ncbi:MAG: arsenate reductase [Bdellovibrionales bacterium GWA2_49_15]|nr:MAG: arsenate reductase [Bdellovibrionales bacterium GWA2_49_15]HAZ13675.1 arsenate reductase [Bdellovibrionales bacterium]
MQKKLNILFLCTGNSCRSQMAEGWCHVLKAESIEAYSAGIKKHGMNPRAIQVMSEAGVDISKQYSKTTAELPAVKFDFVFTVCGDAHENCPFFPGGKVIHVGFDDPPKLTQKMQNEEQILEVYRRVRDEIKAFILEIEKYC